jgi:sugar phosphate isomerase/epimerase
MKLGFMTAIMADETYEEVVDFASMHGFQCLEVACWPSGKAERRYAGVSHIDVERVIDDPQYAEYVTRYAKERKVELAALAYYPNMMDSDVEKRKQNIAHFKKVVQAAHILHVAVVTTFIGREQEQNVQKNLEVFEEVWPELIAFAEKEGIKVAIENCPMLFGEEQWPGGQNLMTSPVIWRELFERISSPMFGLNFDPSHFVWQEMDYIAPLYEFKDKLFHIHFKDIKMDYAARAERGIMAYPLDYMSPKLPGLGDVQWNRFVSALTDIGYEGYACIEVEDRAFEGTRSKIEASLLLSKRYLEQYVIDSSPCVDAP